MAGIPLELTLFAVKVISAGVLLREIPSLLGRITYRSVVPKAQLTMIAVAATVLLAAYGVFGNPFHV